MGPVPHFELRVSSFHGTQNLPGLVAERLGYFRANGLSVQLSYTGGSATQLVALAAGEHDLIQTAPDNVINFTTNPEAFGVPPEEAPRLIMLMGGTTGPLTLYGRPGISGIADLRGTMLGVDNPGSGFALVLRDLLARAGLLLDRDYTFLVAGGTAARCSSLVQGKIAGTMLYLPFDLRAGAAGCAELASSRDAYAAYASLAIVGRLDWVTAHGAAVTAFLQALLRAQVWMRQAEHSDQLRTILHDTPELGVDHAVLDAALARITGATGISYGAPDEAGLRQVIALRASLTASRRPLGHPQDYCDPTWYRAAQLSLGA